MAKNNIRSFRFSDKVFEILNNFKGESLNNKFENLVHYCFTQIPETELRLKQLDSRINELNSVIAEKENEVIAKQKEIADLKKIKLDIGVLITNLETVKRQMKIVGDISTQITDSQMTFFKKTQNTDNDRV